MIIVLIVFLVFTYLIDTAVSNYAIRKNINCNSDYLETLKKYSTLKRESFKLGFVLITIFFIIYPDSRYTLSVIPAFYAIATGKLIWDVLTAQENNNKSEA